MSITEQDLKDAYKNGQYSNPAWKRYSNTGETNIICDRCRKTNLKICIGYGKIDLCLNCVTEMQKLEERDNFTPKPIMSDSPPLTFMMQDQFRSSMPVPMMMQRQFRRNNNICEENIIDKISKIPEKIDRKSDVRFNEGENK